MLYELHLEAIIQDQRSLWCLIFLFFILYHCSQFCSQLVEISDLVQVFSKRKKCGVDMIYIGFQIHLAYYWKMSNAKIKETDVTC